MISVPFNPAVQSALIPPFLYALMSHTTQVFFIIQMSCGPVASLYLMLQ
jgi:hypothetical protein